MNESAPALQDPFTSSLAGRRLGRYEVLARLASGGMAGVYVARALGVAGFERLFAIKVLHPHLAHEQEFISMFLDEARLAARIRHPNVVPTIDISDTEDAGYFLVMDYIEGDHLGALLQQAYRRGTRLPTAVALRVAVDALNGLGAAHALTDENGQRINLVHRDVSPHNVMVSTDGIARITDFGVAKAEVRLSTTQDGQFKGKLAYMAPEHASNGEADQRSDLFSMAIILWESLTGRRLFRAENHAATLHKICLEPIPLLSSVDPALAPFDGVLMRGLERDRDLRFQTAEEFAEAIEAHAHELDGIANPRLVGKLVREYAAEKLERDQGLIRSAVAEINLNGGQPEFPPKLSAPVPRAPAPAPIVAPPPPIAPPPAADPLEDNPFAQKPRRVVPLVVGGLALIAAGLAAAAYFLHSEPARVESAPLTAPAVEPVVEPTPAPEPATPEPAAVAEPTTPTTPEPNAAQPNEAREPSAEPSKGVTPRAETRPDAPKPDAVDEEPNDSPRTPKKPRKPKAATADDLLLNPYRTR